MRKKNLPRKIEHSQLSVNRKKILILTLKWSTLLQWVACCKCFPNCSTHTKFSYPFPQRLSVIFRLTPRWNAFCCSSSFVLLCFLVIECSYNWRAAEPIPSKKWESTRRGHSSAPPHGKRLRAEQLGSSCNPNGKQSYLGSQQHETSPSPLLPRPHSGIT